jgi:hypothetical protein
VGGFNSKAAYIEDEDYKNNPNITTVILPVSEPTAKNTKQYMKQFKDKIEEDKIIKYAGCDKWRQSIHGGNITFINCNTATTFVAHKTIPELNTAPKEKEINSNKYTTTGYNLYHQLASNPHTIVNNPIKLSPTTNSKTVQPQVKLSERGFFGSIANTMMHSFIDAVNYKTSMANGK